MATAQKKSKLASYYHLMYTAILRENRKRFLFFCFFYWVKSYSWYAKKIKTSEGNKELYVIRMYE